ncbi:MAG: hypothetical protein H6815_04435 [Phycisphaeraceae bacterium]|nr:hypothetical protein [Phycisphaerales bacterium]MCB9859680.1 hypothetical protein [Phycisphaeraceae bacterium]
MTQICVFDPKHNTSLSIRCKETWSIVRTEYVPGSTDKIHPAMFSPVLTIIDSDADLIANVRAPFDNNHATSREWFDPESIVWSTTAPKSIQQQQENP